MKHLSWHKQPKKYSLQKLNKMILKRLLLFFMLGISLWQCKEEDTFKQGKYLYQNNCAACHMDDGTGLGALIPPLAQSDYLRKHNKQIACLIKYGIADTLIVKGIQYTEKMEGIKKMTPESMTNIINYINHAWGNNIAPITLKEVKDALNHCSE